MNHKITIFLLSVGTILPTFAAETLRSPDGKVSATIDLQNGESVYTLAYQGKTVLEKASAGIQLKGDQQFKGGFEIASSARRQIKSSWKPIWGERSVVPENYTRLTQVFKEKGPRARSYSIEWRAYNEGFAFRYLFTSPTAAKLAKEKTTFSYPAETVAWAINGTEETVPEKPGLISERKLHCMMPLTARLPNGLYTSIFEAYAVHYPRAKIHNGETIDNEMQILLLGPVDFPANQEIFSPWRAILIGERPGDLIERDYLVLNLNPPCAIEDTSWIHPGITLSNEMNCGLKEKDLFTIADLFADQGIRYLQLDWGWYGTEWSWTDKEREQYKKVDPKFAKDTSWEANIKVDPYRVARGHVPYRPQLKGGTTVDLDMEKLINHLRKRDIGLCLYLHKRVIFDEGNDIGKMFSTYQKWGLAGLKPGFVDYGPAWATDNIRKLVTTAAKHKLWLCVHDAHVPDGMERTYPNLMLTEGGGGQEGMHPVRQDVTLPFTRCLAGPFDYTPFIYKEGKSHTHGVAFCLIYPGGSTVLRGGYRQINSRGPDRIGVEWEFIRRLPMNWDETRVLDGQIGDHIITARRKGSTWYVAGMTGVNPLITELPLDFLPKEKEFKATLFLDDIVETEKFRPAVKKVVTVKADQKLTIPMAKSGGFAAIFE